jgi:ATP-dependent Clp protease ATP-binding subunit ClpA
VKTTQSLFEQDLTRRLAARVVGQERAIRSIVPYVQMHVAGLSPEGRPLGVFLLLGPTGTGKTRTVEALAEVLHGTAKHMLKIDCGEFGQEHEVARLIGAPPGYLGHRETHPLLTQPRLTAVSSKHSDISIVLFDEIEKAAPSLTRLLLGVLDKATLRLGDNSSVNFERSLIFLTSNLGASGIMKALHSAWGFTSPGESNRARDIENAAVSAVRRHFSPEFVNRIDATLTYAALGDAELRGILDIQLRELQAHICKSLAERAFSIEVRPEGRRYLLEAGVSREYGARELKRVIHRELVQPLSSHIAAGRLHGCRRVRVDYSKRAGGLIFKAAA